MDCACPFSTAPAAAAFPLFDQVLAEGENLADALSTVDASQEAKRLEELPEAVRKFYEVKGALYTALKVINDAAHALHADNPIEAGRFNLVILYRRGTPVTKAPATPTIQL